MKVKEVAETLERFAPLPLQEGYDNAGFQIGLTAAEDVSGVLLCLDVTEEVIAEAAQKGCNLIVAHHPLLFRGVKCIDRSTIVGRCVLDAISAGIGIYAAHTNLDNARGGVNFAAAKMLGLEDVRFLQPTAGGEGGSGIIGTLSRPMPAADFLQFLKTTFHADSLAYAAGPQSEINTVAFCGGAGDFLVDEAVKQGADIFITGEMGYHRYFGHGNELWLATLGHYETERHTIALLHEVLAEALPGLRLVETDVNTNPLRYI